MTRLTRRGLLGASALAAVGVATGCSSSGNNSSSGAAAGSSGGLEWWDHFSSFQSLNDNWAKTESTSLKTNITHTYYDASKAPEAYQLAHQANKMPDVYSNVIGLPLSALVSGKWVHEMTLPEDVRSKIPANTLTEGVTGLDGKLYGFPLFSLRQSSTLVWTNKDLWTKAGVDGDNPPQDYDGFKTALMKLKSAGIQPVTLAIGADGSRIRDQVDDMAQAAGFPGYQGLTFTSGEYQYDHDAYVTVIEYIKELNDSKLILPLEQLQRGRRPYPLCDRCRGDVHRRHLATGRCEGAGPDGDGQDRRGSDPGAERGHEAVLLSRAPGCGVLCRGEQQGSRGCQQTGRILCDRGLSAGHDRSDGPAAAQS